MFIFKNNIYKNGVNCLAFHDKKTLKVKVKNNDLYFQCQALEAFVHKQNHGQDQSYISAIHIAPDFEAAYVNLTVLNRQQQRLPQ